jgi:hypothetical protein
LPYRRQRGDSEIMARADINAILFGMFDNIRNLYVPDFFLRYAISWAAQIARDAYRW